MQLLRHFRTVSYPNKHTKTSEDIVRIYTSGKTKVADNTNLTEFYTKYKVCYSKQLDMRSCEERGGK